MVEAWVEMEVGEVTDGEMVGRLKEGGRGESKANRSFQRCNYAFGNRARGRGSLTAGVAQGNRSQVRLDGLSAGHFST